MLNYQRVLCPKMGGRSPGKILENDDHADLGVRISDMLQASSSNRSTRNKIGDCLFVHEKVDREQIENTRMCMETY